MGRQVIKTEEYLCASKQFSLDSGGLAKFRCRRSCSKTQTDYCEGVQLNALPGRLREQLGPKIIPSERMALPNYIVELKSTSGDFNTGRNQRRNAGAISVQAYEAVISGLPNAKHLPTNAYVSSIGFDGERMESHIHYSSPPTRDGNTAEYHMRRIHVSQPIATFEEYKRCKSAFKNIRDHCQNIRQEFVTLSEQYQLPAISPPSLPPASNYIIGEDDHVHLPAPPSATAAAAAAAAVAVQAPGKHWTALCCLEPAAAGRAAAYVRSRRLA